MSERGTLTLDNPQPLAPLAHSEAPPAHDLRHALMTLPVAEQNHLLSEYKARRDNFRSWLMSQLIEGTHFGVVPGCEPKCEQRSDGKYYGVWNKRKNAYDFHNERQWTPKPSLYAAGADFICDILGVRDEYETDRVAWEQMGSKAGNAVVKCRLKSRATGELIGESLGAYYHQYDPNNALKMASKCAKVGAVINAYDLRDLFTQDESPPPPNDNPRPDATVPTEVPRAKRAAKPPTEVSEEQVAHILSEWKSKHPDKDGNLLRQRDEWKKWVLEITKRQFKPALLSEWTLADYKACCSALAIPTLEELT